MIEAHHFHITYNLTRTTYNAHCACGWAHRDGGDGAEDRADAAIQRHYAAQGLHTTPKGETLDP